jgi:hypothetical protein
MPLRFLQDFRNGAASSCNEGMAGEDRPIEESVTVAA